MRLFLDWRSILPYPFVGARKATGWRWFGAACRKWKIVGMMSSLVRISIVVLMAGLLFAGCTRKKDRYVANSVGNLYELGYKQLNNGRYKIAAAAFDEVERQHPYSAWARRAELMSAYSHYLSNDYDQAILSAQRYVALHPGNANAAYAYYLIGICYYEQMTDVGRDQNMTERALLALNEVVRRYPDSEYAGDARLKLDLTLDHLAGKEMAIGRWYLRQGYYLAAIMRFENVVRQYDRTTHVPEALHRLTEAYLSMGVVEEARASAAALSYNYPNNPWYKDSYALLKGKGIEPDTEKQRSWFVRLLAKVF